MDIKKNFQAEFSIDLNQKPVIFDYINNGITITDQHSTIVYTNAAFSKITGYTKEEAQGQNPGMLHSGQHDEHYYKNMWKSIIEHGFWEGEIWNRRKSGQVYPEFLTISKIKQKNSDDVFYIAVFSDISFLKKDIKHKLHLAFYDPLTELPNRNLYLDRVNNIIDTIKNTPDQSTAILYMDLDKFKHVNDTYGHCTGDKLLKEVGERLQSIIRKGDTIARIGGDEFTAILAANCTKEIANNFAERIVSVIEKPFSIDGHPINISISIGLSMYPKDASEIEALLKDADIAMYTAKKTGARFLFYDALANTGA